MNPVCRWWRRDLARQAALGETQPSGTRLEQHVASCPACRAAWDELRALAADLPQVLAAPGTSSGFTEGVWARIAVAPYQSSGTLTRRIVVRPWPLGGTIGAAALGLVLYGWYMPLGKRGSTKDKGAGGVVRSPRSASPGSDRDALRPVLQPNQAPLQRGISLPDHRFAHSKPGGDLAGVRTEVRMPEPGMAPEHADFRPHSGNSAEGYGGRHQAAASRLGDDLAYVNADPAMGLRPWAALPVREWTAVEEKLRREVRVRDDFITVPFPRLVAADARQIAEAAESYRREAAVMDPRLAREVTVAVKGTALSDLCEQLREETGIHLVAGRSVADEKVTVFCKQQPLRDLMRQLSRPFGYTWLRSGKPGDYRYELAQDLKSQLLEEELRNRDRNEALLALDEEMNQFRRYFGMTPDEALAKAKTAPPEERQRLERYAGTGWGPAQMYFRLSPQDIERLRAGRRVTFNVGPGEEEQALPPELAAGVLESMRDMQARQQGELFLPTGDDEAGGAALTSLPGIRPKVTLEMSLSDLGQFTLVGGAGFGISSTPGDGRHRLSERELAVGISPAVRNPQNGATNARLTRDPALQPRVTVALPGKEVQTTVARGNDVSPLPVRKVTSADVLEVLHRATGVPIVADYYTRLHPVNTLHLKDRPLFGALNQVCDAMRLRWNKDGTWVQIRSTSFFHDRLKEVPNHLLSRWAASRKEHGALTFDDLMEIAGLTDAQLDAGSVAEGIRELYGLAEWDLVRRRSLRPHLRFLAQLTRAQRQDAMSHAGLPFTKLLLPQQQQFITVAFGGHANRLRSLEELAQATMRIEYSLPGGFEWRTSARPGAPSMLPPSFEPARVRAASREAALQAARKLNPSVTEGQISPTELAVMIEYSLGPNSPYRPSGIRVGPWGTVNSIGLMSRQSD